MSNANSWERLNETALPHKEAFFSSLTDENVSEDDYKHAQKAWKTFNIRTLAEYLELCLKLDILLLAEVFENFREVCLRIYKLDPAHYITAPSLGWQRS